MSIQVTKNDGTRVLFEVHRLRESLEKSGAGEALIDQIVAEVEEQLHDGIATRTIYKWAFNLLRKKSKSVAARYKLKRAITELGPTGYPFERFVGELLQQLGYETSVGVVMEGKCINHEIDVVARNGRHTYLVECKFHKDYDRKSNIQIPLYFNSRVQDIQAAHDGDEIGWIVTNTKFSEDSIRYAECVGLKLMGWDYPEKGSLKERIDLSGLHPVTCLSSLTRNEKKLLVEKDIVLCRQLLTEVDELEKFGIHKNKRGKVRREIEGLLEVH